MKDDQAYLNILFVPRFASKTYRLWGREHDGFFAFDVSSLFFYMHSDEPFAQELPYLLIYSGELNQVIKCRCGIFHDRLWSVFYTYNEYKVPMFVVDSSFYLPELFYDLSEYRDVFDDIINCANYFVKMKQTDLVSKSFYNKVFSEFFGLVEENIIASLTSVKPLQLVQIS